MRIIIISGFYSVETLISGSINVILVSSLEVYVIGDRSLTRHVQGKIRQPRIKYLEVSRS